MTEHEKMLAGYLIYDPFTEGMPEERTKAHRLCKLYNVQISTSLDGPEFIHNYNRGRIDSYSRVVKGIHNARTYVGHSNVNALMTTSTLGVNYPIEIVDEYVKLGFRGIFLRALNTYGLASENENWEEYTNRFIEFYKTALSYIIDKNKKGVFSQRLLFCFQ